MSIVILGDLHIRKEEPFLKASENFFNWFVEQEFNSEQNILVQLGDFCHRSKPSPLVYEQIYKALKQFKFKEIYILGGNHDYEKADDSYAFYPFREFPNFRYITLSEVYEIEGKMCMFLPHMYKKPREKSEQNFYEVTIDTLSTQAGKPIDITFHHLATEKQSYQEKYDIESQYLLGIQIGGHIHIQDEDYIGVPYPTRADEVGQRGQIGILKDGKREYIPVPMFLDYRSVMFGDEPNLNKEGVTLLNIIDAPSKQEANKRYKDYYINKVELLLMMDAEGSDKPVQINKKSDLEFFEDFEKEFKFDSRVSDKIRKVLR